MISIFFARSTHGTMHAACVQPECSVQLEKCIAGENTGCIN